MGLLTRVIVPGLQVPTDGKSAVDLRAMVVKDRALKRAGKPQPKGSANEAVASTSGTDHAPPNQLNEGS